MAANNRKKGISQTRGVLRSTLRNEGASQFLNSPSQFKHYITVRTASESELRLMGDVATVEDELWRGYFQGINTRSEMGDYIPTQLSTPRG